MLIYVNVLLYDGMHLFVIFELKFTQEKNVNMNINHQYSHYT